MKLSNLILTFVLALIASFSLHSQSNNTREISVENDKESIYVKYENGDLLELKIEGETIPKDEYSKYQILIDKYSSDTPIPPTNVNSAANNVETEKEESSVQNVLNENLKAYLSDINLINSASYKLKLTSKYIKLNGKKLENGILNKCLAIFERTAGYELNSQSYFKVKITSNSRSISLSIED